MAIQEWSQSVKREIELQVTPQEFVQDIKKLTKCKNPQVALSALKTLGDMQGVGKATLELPPMLIFTMPPSVEPSGLAHYITQGVTDQQDQEQNT